ncbi:MAG: S8 family serine peptidase [Steroidobacteraceae bacterium]|jgi:subtilisin family serine protease
MRVLLATLLLCCAPRADAQLGLPPVRLPSLPAVNVPGVLPGITDSATAPLDTGQLRELRHLRVRELLRRHRDVLEADPHGELIVRGEVLALAPEPAALEAAMGAGFTIAREQTFPELGTRLVVLHVTGDTARALQRMQALDAAGSYDFNHVYLDSGALPGAQRSAADAAGDTDRPDANLGAPGALARIGLIDSGVDAGHGAFHGLALHQHGCAGAVVPAAHGTAVASLLVGRADGFHGAAPGAELYAADVFCGLATGGSVDAVAAAFAWLVAERVAVINVSLVGPADRTLERIVLNVVARGYLVVAAVGNDGPAAPPLYPAAWPGVIGVTAVDTRGRVLPEAERGPQVKFAAPGADMAAAGPPHGYVLVRGTSFAAPIVAGLLALELSAADVAAAGQAVQALAARAQHRGSAGIDPAYGYGVVGADLRPPATLASRGTD